jgi:hypothetical protein
MGMERLVIETRHLNGVSLCYFRRDGIARSVNQVGQGCSEAKKKKCQARAAERDKVVLDSLEITI